MPDCPNCCDINVVIDGNNPGAGAAENAGNFAPPDKAQPGFDKGAKTDEKRRAYGTHTGFARTRAGKRKAGRPARARARGRSGRPNHRARAALRNLQKRGISERRSAAAMMWFRDYTGPPEQVPIVVVFVDGWRPKIINEYILEALTLRAN